ncbi:MAG TPA: AraC family transcriptional regulator ligand-binding domain-containing protein [Casimicrobiaceae bacterium]|nr:AraC family transcriptional regulator ligand-binding domain-containing protein [Casimicrobiaceae bacterium]
MLVNPPSRRPAEHPEWVQRVGAYTELPALLRMLGADPSALLAAAGLAPDALDRADGTVSFAALGRLFARAIEATGCPHVGVLTGRMWHLADIGVVGEMVRHSPTLGDALRVLVVHHHLNCSGGLVYLLVRGNAVDLGYAIYAPRVEGAEALCVAPLAAGRNYLTELLGPGSGPTEVLLPQRRPADVAPYRACFHVVPRFDAEAAALRFPAAWLARPIAGADPARYRAARQRADALGHGELQQRLRRAIRILRLSGEVSGEMAAKALELHRRTLNRRLKAQGTTFQVILDEVRAEAACQLLEGTSTSLDDIASSLGYASVSPFMRAFRRWTGNTPGSWRRDPSARVKPAA